LSEGCQRCSFWAEDRSGRDLQKRPPNHRDRPRSGTAPRRPAWPIRRTHWHEKC
jgi:hypothetical protein